MRVLFILLTLLPFLEASAQQLPTNWEKSYVSDSSCEFDIEVYTLKNTSLAFALIENTKIELVKEIRFEDFSSSGIRRYYVSTQDENSMPPTYELRLTEEHESSLPQLTTFFSGSYRQCFMNKVDRKSSKLIHNSFKNVGSIGH